MESRASMFGHPMHPVLIVFPAALFPLMLFLDAVHWFAPSDGLWTGIFWLAVAGVATTMVAIIPGLIDLKHVPDGTRAKRTGIVHMSLGFGLLVLYGVAVGIRWPGLLGDNFVWATAVDVAGVIGVSVQGYLGGTLVYKHHLGVATEAEGADPTAWEGAPSTGAARGRAARRELRP